LVQHHKYSIEDLENIIPFDDIRSVCGNDDSPRVLVDRVNPINDISGYNNDDIRNKRVIISFYKNEDSCYKPGEKGVYFIEATGPWNRVTWLETTMMQCVYETKLRYDLEKTGKGNEEVQPLLSKYEDGYHYQNVLAPLVKLESDEDRMIKENQRQEDISIRWDKSLSNKKMEA
jgi:hypothetical protein